jgi:hypothetical protein
LLLVAALLFTSAAAAKVPKGSTNLRITATGLTSVSLAWDAAKSGGGHLHGAAGHDAA